MRERPKESTISRAAWECFNKLAEEAGYGYDEEDWFPWFEAFQAGYEQALEEGEN